MVIRVLRKVHREKSCRSLTNEVRNHLNRFSACFYVLLWGDKVSQWGYDGPARRISWVRHSREASWSLKRQQYRDYSLEQGWRGRTLRVEVLWGFGASGRSFTRQSPSRRTWSLPSTHFIITTIICLSLLDLAWARRYDRFWVLRLGRRSCSHDLSPAPRIADSVQIMRSKGSLKMVTGSARDSYFENVFMSLSTHPRDYMYHCIGGFACVIRPCP